MTPAEPNDPTVTDPYNPGVAAPPVFRLYNCTLMTPVPVNAPISYYCKPTNPPPAQPQVLDLPAQPAPPGYGVVPPGDYVGTPPPQANPPGTPAAPTYPYPR
jgi:hypothetical protein